MATMQCNAGGHLCAQHAVHLWMQWAWGNFAPFSVWAKDTHAVFDSRPAAGYVWEFSMYDTPQELELREGQVGAEYLARVLLHGGPPSSCCFAHLSPRGAAPALHLQPARTALSLRRPRAWPTR